MADPAVYEDDQKTMEINTAYTKLKDKIKQLNQDWEKLAEEIESLQEIIS